MEAIYDTHAYQKSIHFEKQELTLQDGRGGWHCMILRRSFFRIW
jgi:hypothetical protein